MAAASPEDAEFAQVLKEKIKGLLSKAKKGLPETCSIYNNIYMHAKFLDQYEFFVPQDRSLDTVIMWKTTKPSYQHVGLLSYEKPAKVVQLLDKTKLLDWNRITTFMHLSPTLADPIAQLLKRKGKGHTHSSHATLYTMDKKGQKGIPLRCPKGYKVCQLGKKGITTMLNAWRYNNTYSMPEFQKFMENVPCVGLFLEAKQVEDYEVNIKDLPKAGVSENPIAYATVFYFGAMGMLGCEEKHWSDGLMGLVIQVCGRMMADSGLISHLYVEGCDVKIKTVMDVLPGWETGPEYTWTWNCTGTKCL